MNDANSILQKISRMRDDALNDMTKELLTNPRFAEALGHAVQKATRAKSRMNRNVALMMSLGGLPTKKDYDALAQRAQGLSKTLVRMEERIDEMSARIEKLTDRVSGRGTEA
jgi:predicted  nucleic acid-binding Zn-ribbon protein